MAGIELIWHSWPQLWAGLSQTLLISLATMLVSTLGGLLYALICLQGGWLGRAVMRGYLELVRAVPLLVWLFLFFFGLPIAFGLDLPSTLCAIVVFSVWGITEIGEVARGALQSVPRGQHEAGSALGLSRLQLYRYVLIPQALRRMLPPSVNVYTRIIKTSSLSVLIGVTEVIKAGQQIIERTHASFAIYGALFVLYFLLCFPLSTVSRHLEWRWRER